jgi:hypothetical protein
MGKESNRPPVLGDIPAYEELSLVELLNRRQVIDRLIEAKLEAELGEKATGVFEVISVDAARVTPDEIVALRWLNGNEKLPQRGFPSPGQAATVKILQRVNHPVYEAVAGALEPIGTSEMKLVLKRRRGRGRPPGGAQLAHDRVKLAKTAEAEIAKKEAKGDRKPRRDAETTLAAEKAGRKRSAGYDSRAALKRAKDLEKE